MPFLLGVVLPLERTQLIRPRARRAEIRVQALAAPRRLDDEHRLVERRIHREAEGELRPDLVAGLGGVQPPHRPIACRQFAIEFEVLLVGSGQIRNPRAIAHRRLAVGTPHHFEHRRGRRVVADVIKGLDARRSFHVRLSGEDEDFELLRLCAAVDGCIASAATRSSRMEWSALGCFMVAPEFLLLVVLRCS